MSKKHHKLKKIYSSSKGIAWLYSEVCALLDVWSEKEIQRQLSGRLHNMCVYEQISVRLRDLRIDRTAEQCREKIKKLKRDYKVVVDNNYSPAFARKLLGCYDKVHEVFGKCGVRTIPISRENEKFDEDNTVSTCDFLENENNSINNNNRSENTSSDDNNLSESYQNFNENDSRSESSSTAKSDSEMFLDSDLECNLNNNQLERTEECIQKTFQLFSSSREKFHAKYLEMECNRLKRDLDREKARLKLIEMKRQQEHEREFRLFKTLLSLVACQKENHCNK